MQFNHQEVMRFICIIIFNFILCSAVYAQEGLFNIREVIDTVIPKKTPKDFVKSSAVFFEDEHYLISKTCSGEWGGTVKFKNKKTGIEYACAANCPLMVNKIAGKYILTNTLAHLIGFSEILEIENPDSMTVFKLSKPRKVKGKFVRYVGDDESKSVKGTRKLFDGTGILMIASFPYQEQLYHIVTDTEKTFLSKIEEGKLVTIATISDKSIRDYKQEVIRTVDNRYLIFFNNARINGYIEISGNEILLMRYK